MGQGARSALLPYPTQDPAPSSRGSVRFVIATGLRLRLALWTREVPSPGSGARGLICEACGHMTERRRPEGRTLSMSRSCRKPEMCLSLPGLSLPQVVAPGPAGGYSLRQPK